MRRSRRVLASALLGLLVGLLTTILLVVPAGAAFVLGGKAPSEQLTYSYDSPSTTTTPPATSRTDAARGRPGARTSPDAVRLVSGSFLAAKAEHSTVIGKVKDVDDLAPGENTLLKHLPNRGNPRANWKQNSGVLRREMGKGRPIRDASVDPRTGELIQYPGSFLNAERALLRDRGWRYDPSSRLWRPPG